MCDFRKSFDELPNSPEAIKEERNDKHIERVSSMIAVLYILVLAGVAYLLYKGRKWMEKERLDELGRYCSIPEIFTKGEK